MFWWQGTRASNLIHAIFQILFFFQSAFLRMLGWIKWVIHSRFFFWRYITNNHIFLLRSSFFEFMAWLGFIPPPPLNLGPSWYQSSRSPLIYLVGSSAILDCHINICVGPPNTCIALKQFNLLPPNTLFWSNFIYYPLAHQFEAITLDWIKTCVKWFWDNFDWD